MGSNTPRIRITLLLMILAGLLLLSTVGCTTIEEKKLEKDGLTLIFRDPSQLGSEITEITLAHPIRISVKELTLHLQSLQYEHLSLLGKKGRVFNQEAVEKLQHVLTRALNRISPKRAIYYEVRTQAGKTVGELFSAGGHLHWRMLKIDDQPYPDKAVGVKEPAWRLVPQNGQSLYSSSQLFGDKTWNNWIVADLRLQEATRAAEPDKARDTRPQKPVAQPNPKVNPDPEKQLEEKLKFLKKLRQKELIEEEEYRIKRKELLDQFF